MRADATPTPARKFLAALVAGIGLVGLAVTPAAAASQPYLGWDFGHGVGVGIGTPPSAYDPCPTYGWPVYPYRCGHYYPRRARHARHYRSYY